MMSRTRRHLPVVIIVLVGAAAMLQACAVSGLEGGGAAPPGSSGERAASLLRSFERIRSLRTVEDPALLGQALGVTIRMARYTPDYREAYVSDDPRVPNGSWVSRRRPDGTWEAGLELTPLASGLCITHRDLVYRFGRRVRIDPALQEGRIYDANIALGGGSYYWPVVEEPGLTLYVGAEFFNGDRRCASYLKLSIFR